MPQMEELAARLNVTKDELFDAVADTGYDLVPSAEGPEMAGDEGPEDTMAEDEEMAAEDEGMAAEEEMEGGPMGLPPLPGMMADRPSEDENPRMKMKMLVMNAAGKALKGKKGK